MGQPFFFWSMAIKMHFYFKCVFLIKSLNYFHMRQKKKNTSTEKNKGKLFLCRKFSEQNGSYIKIWIRSVGNLFYS